MTEDRAPGEAGTRRRSSASQPSVAVQLFGRGLEVTVKGLGVDNAR